MIFGQKRTPRFILRSSFGHFWFLAKMAGRGLSKLHGSICDNEVTVVGYNIVRRDRLANDKSGGGICFYIRSNIAYFLREDLVMDRLKMLSIDVRKLSTKPFVITTWYRPPNSSADLSSHLDILLRKLDTENIEHYLMGI